MTIQQVIIKANEIIVGAHFTKLKTTKIRKPLYLLAELQDGFAIYGNNPKFSGNSTKFYVIIDNARFQLAR